MKMTKWIYSLLLVTLFTSCGKFLDDYSQDLVIPKTVQELDEVLLGNGYLPRKEVSELSKGGLTWWTHLLDDDINTVYEQIAVRGFLQMDQFYFGYTTWQLEVGRSYNGLDLRNDNYDWEELYRRINAMNIILSEVDEMPQNTENDKLTAKRVKGESYFLRAQYYLTLVNLYAPMYSLTSAEQTLGVPLKLTHYVEYKKDNNTQFQRASVAAVYNQIVNDLKQSVEYLKNNDKNKTYRATEQAALLLLSRVYLYMQDWVNAEQAAQQVIDKNSMLVNYSSINSDVAAINADNAEIIFTQGPLNVQNVLTARGGDFCVSADLYNSFSDDDYRKNLFFAREAYTDSIALSRKFTRGVQLSAVSDLFLLRVSEAYLNLMEAKAMQHKDDEARTLLNEFRRFRMSNVPQDLYVGYELVDQIRNERRKEFCFEGHRWFDLRRYAINNLYPLKKEIERSYTVYNWDDKNKPVKTLIYKLDKDDLAYTFNIPKAVLDFDRTMPDNPRMVRKPIVEIPLN
ncbi:MAG: RagB/SusD family nutrient uptake outer membrane protein [Bacteroidia bacterium]|nr:MAG: RagB/SusD family nutrient uptake outer membrane protein [Bacteroidia bacterium]